MFIYDTMYATYLIYEICHTFTVLCLEKSLSKETSRNTDYSIVDKCGLKAWYGNPDYYWTNWKIVYHPQHYQVSGISSSQTQINQIQHFKTQLCIRVSCKLSVSFFYVGLSSRLASSISLCVHYFYPWSRYRIIYGNSIRVTMSNSFTGKPFKYVKSPAQ